MFCARSKQIIVSVQVWHKLSCTFYFVNYSKNLSLYHPTITMPFYRAKSTLDVGYPSIFSFITIGKTNIFENLPCHLNPVSPNPFLQ